MTSTPYDMIPSEHFNGANKAVNTWHVVIAFIVSSLLIAAYSHLIGLNITPFLISPDPQLDFCCSPANSFVLPMFSMTSDSWRC
ncbi:hypothetical protein [Xanthomonas oryzae]|uniref:hypothetical protein n=1 Tax=Xanthomonas oryzae TaxID=347 RepID=UPI0011BE7320|nr:hypothetical protein [Xanthomonas oryzae]